ncbi:hypothetical protein SPRG_22024, partial [Saprolegnia parasitica CBS 223.65]
PAAGRRHQVGKQRLHVERRGCVWQQEMALLVEAIAFLAPKIHQCIKRHRFHDFSMRTSPLMIRQSLAVACYLIDGRLSTTYKVW